MHWSIRWRGLPEKVSILFVTFDPTKIALLFYGLAGEIRHRRSSEDGGGDGKDRNANLLFQKGGFASANISCDDKTLRCDGELDAVWRSQKRSNANGSAFGPNRGEEKRGRERVGVDSLNVRKRSRSDRAIEIRD